MKQMIYLLILLVLLDGFLWSTLYLHSELQKNSELQSQISSLSYQVDSIRRQEGAILDAKAVYSIKNTNIKDKIINWTYVNIIALENVAFIDDKFNNACDPQATLELDGGENTVIANNTFFGSISTSSASSQISLLADNDTPWGDLWNNEFESMG